MAIFAISDLHLSLGTDKPMDIFGWGDHASKIKNNWENKVTSEDYVLIPGDISWGINMKEADSDFAFIESLPGNKIMLKGNHDYWWSTRSKFDKYCQEKGYNTLSVLHNNAIEADKYIICGTRGWKSKDEDSFNEDDLRIYNRELERLKISMKAGNKSGKALIVMFHYPPFDSRNRPNEFAQILMENNVSTCVYGHIHSKAAQDQKSQNIEGVQYHLVSCNLIDFDPIRVG